MAKIKKPISKFEIVIVKHPIPVGSRQAFAEKVEKLKYPARLKQSEEIKK